MRLPLKGLCHGLVLLWLDGGLAGCGGCRAGGGGGEHGLVLAVGNKAVEEELAGLDTQLGRAWGCAARGGGDHGVKERRCEEHPMAPAHW